MNSLDGENYCEAMALNVVRIKDKVDKTRLKLAQEASKTFDYKDPTANNVVEQGTALESIKIHIDGEEVEILQPELWVKTIYLAIKRFKERYGVEAGATIIDRYVKAHDALQVYVKQGISRRSFGDRREKFLKMLLLYAVQNNLLSVS